MYNDETLQFNPLDTSITSRTHRSLSSCHAFAPPLLVEHWLTHLDPTC
jgi:hypothetical protein